MGLFQVLTTHTSPVVPARKPQNAPKSYCTRKLRRTFRAIPARTSRFSRGRGSSGEVDSARFGIPSFDPRLRKSILRMSVLERILKSQQLPTLPSVAIRLLDLTRDPETELKDVIAVVKTDPALATKILKAANSTFFGLSSPVTTIDRAIPLLGATVATSLSLSFCLSDDTMLAGALAEHYRQYWIQSIVQAAGAECLEKYTRKGAGSELFLCGLLLDIGRLAMLKTLGKHYVPVLEQSENSELPLQHCERQAYGCDHLEVGRELLRAWRIPKSFEEATALHHSELSEIQSASAGHQETLAPAAAVAACLGDYFCTNRRGFALNQLRHLMSALYGLTAPEVEAFLEQVASRIEQAGELFHVDTTILGNPAELLVQANEQLVNLTMREHVANTQATLRHQQSDEERLRLMAKNRELEAQVLHDSLTGLYNRKLFDEALQQEVAKSVRSASPVAILFLDIDRFKTLNDTYGHQFGDIVLQQVATALKGITRATDILARYGGEEFVIVVHQPTEKGLQRFAERLRQAVEVLAVVNGGERVPVTISIGGAMALPTRNDLQIGERLLADADECLYESKRDGRNRVTLRSLLDESTRRLMQMVTQHRFSRWLVQQQVMDVVTVSQILAETKFPKPLFGALAQQCGFLSADEVASILRDQQNDHRRFGEIALTRGLISLQEMVHLLSLQQEDPKQLAAAIIYSGAIAPDHAARLLQCYLSTTAPKRDALATAS